MPRWLQKVLRRLRALAMAGEIRMTLKSQREAALLDLSPLDVRDVVAALAAADCIGRLVSDETGEWMYVFRPEVGGQAIYVKLVLRADCIVVSFHEDGGGEHEEGETQAR